MRKTTAPFIAFTVLALASCGVSLADYYPDDYLVRWDFNESLTDKGSDYDLTADNGTVTWDRSSKKEGSASARFDGSTSLGSPSMSFPDNAVTIAMWLNADETTDPETDVLTWGDYDGILSIRENWRIAGYYGSDGYMETDNGFLEHGEWHHYVLRSTGRITSLFIDGVRQPAVRDDEDISSITGSIHLGEGVGTYNGDYFLVGNLDDIIIWNRALSEAEVLALYQSY